MNIAICLSGQPRLKNEIYENHKQFIFGDTTYFFSHIWWHNSHMGQVIRYHSKERYELNDLSEKVKILYYPKKFEIEDYISFDLSFLKSLNYETWTGVSEKYVKLFTPFVLYSTICQSYSLKKSVDLIDDLENFDVIIRLRFDTIFTKDIKNIIKNLTFSDNTIFIQSSMEGGHKYCGEFPNKPCDWFFCGHPKAMKKFIQTWYQSFPNLYKNGIIHTNDVMKLVSEYSHLNLILYDFGVIVKRQLEVDTNFVDWKNYVEDFDDKKLEVTRRFSDWPYWIKNVDFKILKNI